MNQSKVAIDVTDLTVAYGAEPVLWNVNVQFERGKVTSIIGPNGAGKSTLLKSMLNFLEPLSGTVTFHVNSPNKNSYKHIKKQIAYVPQNRTVDWDFPATVFDIVMMGRYGKAGLLHRTTKKDRQIAQTMLEKVGMTDFSDRQISELSGGQKQRVFLARALAEEPEIYILDEPLAGVDVTTEKIIMKILKELAAQNKTLLVVHHDLQTVAEYFDHVVFLNKEVIAYGPVATTFTDENITNTYQKLPDLPNQGTSRKEVSSNDRKHPSFTG